MSTQPGNKAPPPPTTIQSVSADDKNYQLASALKFPAHTASVQITYAAVSLSDPEAIRFRYKLQETDRDWHEVSPASPVSYRNLAPGSYHFSVNATDTNGVWSDAVATTEFTILPAFYQTGWFIALCLVSALAFLYMLYMLRVRQLARQYGMRLEERVGERTRIARELHDTLLQNLHGLMFQFQAARNLFHKRPEEAMQTLDNAITGTEQAITESQNAIEDLRSDPLLQNDLAQALTAMGNDLVRSQDGTGSSPALRVTVEGERQNLSSAIRVEVYRIAREVLRNAFRYAEAHQIEAEIRYDDQEFRLRIRDDGKGIDPKILEEGRRAGHWGLPGLRERAEKIGARLDFWSRLGTGTEVQLTVPGAVAYETPHSSGFRLFRKASIHDQ